MGATVKPQSGIRVTTLVVGGLVTLVAGWLAMRWFESSARTLPDPGWLGLVAILFLVATLLVAGRQVKTTRDGSAERPITPLRAARILVLGQAGALTGAVLVGWYLASVLTLLPDADIESQRARIWPFAIHAVVALGLAISGMVVQRWCRIRPRDEDEEGANGSGTHA